MKYCILLVSCFFLISNARAQNFLASAYPIDYHGTVVHSGERYSKFIATAASNMVTLGSKILISEQKTGRSVLVKVNDRIEEAAVDFLFSDAVYEELGISREEKIMVKYKVLEGANQSFVSNSSPNQGNSNFRTKGNTDYSVLKIEEIEDLNPDFFTLQMAAFSSYDSAIDFISKLKKDDFGDNPLFIRSVEFDQGNVLFRVLNGHFDTKDSAKLQEEKLEELGYSPIVKPVKGIM